MTLQDAITKKAEERIALCSKYTVVEYSGQCWRELVGAEEARIVVGLLELVCPPIQKPNADRVAALPVGLIADGKDTLMRRDAACDYLCAALNRLPGVTTYESCCGHGKKLYRIWLHMAVPSVGARVLTRCLSKRYYTYTHPWNLYLGDSEDAACFILEGGLSDLYGAYPMAQRLANNLLDYAHCLETAEKG